MCDSEVILYGEFRCQSLLICSFTTFLLPMLTWFLPVPTTKELEWSKLTAMIFFSFLPHFQNSKSKCSVFICFFTVVLEVVILDLQKNKLTKGLLNKYMQLQRVNNQWASGSLRVNKQTNNQRKTQKISATANQILYSHILLSSSNNFIFMSINIVDTCLVRTNIKTKRDN